MRKGEIPFTRQWCKELGEAFRGSILIIPHVAGTLSLEGMPDRQIVHPYWHGWLEFKGVKTPLAPEQISRIREIERLRGEGSVWVARQQVECKMFMQLERWDGSPVWGGIETPLELLEALRRLSTRGSCG